MRLAHGPTLAIGLFLGVLMPATRGSASDIPREVEQTARRLGERALEGNRAYDILRSLTTEVGPRFAGSDGDRRAVAWAKRTLEELDFDRVYADPVTVPHWERGKAEASITAPFPQPLAVIALGGSVGTPEQGVEAEVVEVASREALEALDEGAVKDRIVFFNKPTERTRDGSGYGRAVDVRSKGASAAAARGAVAVVIRSIGTDKNRLPHTGGMRYAKDTPRIPAAALSNPDADLLAAQLERSEPVRLRLRLTSRSLPDAQSANVIGEFTGRDKPEEIVLLGAHLDSWDVGTGALDDGVGCAIVLETARLVAELAERPRRTLRVVLFANEEFGISGARAYAKQHAEEIERHVAAAEADFGAGRVYQFDSRVMPAALGLVDDIQRLLEPLGIERGDNESGGGVDLIPLRPLGVPLFGLSQDGTDYFDYHHTDNDTLDKVNREDLDQVVAAWVTLIYTVADMPRSFEIRPRLQEQDGP